MESVDKLRDYASRNQRVSGWMTALNRIADEIERETEEAEAFCRRVEKAAKNREELDVFGVAYMPLPTDADGVPIRVGDKLIAYNERFDVEGIGDGIVIFRAENDELGELFNPAAMIHVKPRTLEDVLEEYYDKRGWDEADNCALNADELTAKYAAEIRELLGGDAE